MDLSAMNWLAVVAAAVAAFLLGWVYYGVLFGKAWQRLNGLTDEQIANGNSAMIFGGAFALTLIIATALALLMGPLTGHEASLVQGVVLGLMLSLALVATAVGINYLFALKPLKLWLIDTGYMVLMFTLIGAILGVWR